MNKFYLIAAAAFFIISCSQGEGEIQLVNIDESITLPDGFHAELIAENIGRARHLTVLDNGDIYVAIRNTRDEKGGIKGLRDTTGDGLYDQQVEFGHDGGTGIKYHNGYLYFASDTSVVRYSLNGSDLLPEGDYEVIAHGFPKQNSHAVKPFDFDNSGNMYVNVGAPSNSCMEESRTPGSPGMDPCPLLDSTGGVWQFAADELNQHQDNAVHYASGIRNAVAISWNDSAGDLYIVQHGRDQLNTLWPDLYDAEDNAKLPAEEFHRIREGDQLSWPYCYYDPFMESLVLSPEYGGDGEEIGRCDQFKEPLVAFPAHYAPNDLIFYSGDQFPDEYKNGAFVAFHGSWNRAPLEQEGYNVVFLPLSADGTVTGEWSVFADGFAGVETIESPGEAEHRPTGVAAGPDGSLYVSDSQKGHIWRIRYTGN